MRVPCYQHDSFESTCNDCREMNGLPIVTHYPRGRSWLEVLELDQAKEKKA